MATKNDSKKKEMAAILASIENKLTVLFGSRYQEVLRISQVRKAIEAGEDFTFDSSPAAARQMEAIINQLAMQATSLIKQGDSQAWEAGDKTASTTLAATYGKTTDGKATLDALTERGLEDQRQRGATASEHYRQRQESVAFSTAVWQEQAQKDIELLIQNGVKQGKSADEISRDIRPFLKNPTAHYHRVRNKETGELELSKAAKEYHPGAGVYRSAYKNAVRLARTEVNIAYATAQWESYQSNPLVTGIRISLSNNHTTLNSKGKRVPLHDMCDELAGDYPKTFRWTPWHPQCRCTMTPITVSDADFKSRMKALFSGALDDWKPQDTVTKMPETFTGWMVRNKKRLAKGRSIPAFIKDNYQNGNPMASLNPSITQLEAAVRKQAPPETKAALTAEQQKMKQIIDERRKYAALLELTPEDFAPMEELMRLGDKNHFENALNALDDKIDQRRDIWDDAATILFREIQEVKAIKSNINEQQFWALSFQDKEYYKGMTFGRTLGEKYEQILKKLEFSENSTYTYKTAAAALQKALLELQAERRELYTMDAKRRRLKEYHERHKNEEYSPNMPDAFKPGGQYGKTTAPFNREFWDKLDPERPIDLKIFNSGEDTYFAPSGRYVQICTPRGDVSPVYKVCVVYHEFGHGIDYTPLRAGARIGASQEFLDMYNSQKKRMLTLKTRECKKRWLSFVRDANGEIVHDEQGHPVSQKTLLVEKVKAPRLFFIEKRINELKQKLLRMNPEVLARHGYNEHDIREACLSAMDLIMSISSSYGNGHTKEYMSSRENRTTEYLAHAFEAAYQGNAFIRKFMPDIYEEMIQFVRNLPAYWEI